MFVLSAFLFSSYHSSSFQFISFTVEYKKRPRAAAATGSTWATTATRATGTCAVIFFLLSLRSSFLHFTLLLFPLFPFPQVHQHAMQDGAGQDRHRRRQQCRTAQGAGAGVADSYVFFFVLSTLSPVLVVLLLSLLSLFQ